MPESDVAGAALMSPATGRRDGGGIGGSEGACRSTRRPSGVQEWGAAS
jgi:hypothetical protein